MKYKKFPVAALLLATSFHQANAQVSTFAPLELQFEALQKAKANRSATEQKLQSSLLYLALEQQGGLAVPGAPHLKSQVKCEADGRVLVDISAPVTEQLRKAITGFGGTIVSESVRLQSLRASVLPSVLLSLAAREDVSKIKLGFKAKTHTGSITSEGDKAHRTDVSRTDWGVDGSGVKVGVISDSADFSTESIASGDLPTGFTVLPDKFGSGIGEGTAMSEIVHDLAPGAEIYFASANGGKAAFADSILHLQAAGCDIIVDDISYPHEWQFQDDEIAQAINTVVAEGTIYFSSAGNEGSLKHSNSTTWEGDFSDGGTHPLLPGGTVHTFGTQNYNSMVSDSSDVILQWSDEYNSSSNDYDLIVLSADGTSIISAGTDTQDGDDEPIEFADAEPGQQIVIWKANGAAERYVRISCVGGPIAIQTTGQTIGHAATPNCICVASTDANEAFPDAFTTSSNSEISSSDGPHRMFYHPDGSPITPGNFLAASGGGLLIQSPAITGADGGSSTLAEDSGLNPFYGTSAAAPHCAAIAALVLEKNPNLTVAELRTLLESSCLDIEDPGHDINSGYGILMPELALTSIALPQELWRKEHFGTYLANGDAGPFENPDQDGLPNLLEYISGSDPNASNPSPISALTHSDNTFQFTYQYNPGASDVSLFFEGSPSLEQESWFQLTPQTDEFISDEGAYQLWQATFDAEEFEKFFIRLKATDS